MAFVFLAMLLSLLGLIAAIIAYYFKILALDEAKKDLAFFQNEAVKRGHATWNMSTKEPGKIPISVERSTEKCRRGEGRKLKV